MKFKLKHIGNLLVRFFSRDKYYICEECHHICKRDGKEIRLDDDREHLLSHYLWYGSVEHDCFVRSIQETKNILWKDALSRQ